MSELRQTPTERLCDLIEGLTVLKARLRDLLETFPFPPSGKGGQA